MPNVFRAPLLAAALAAALGGATLTLAGCGDGSTTTGVTSTPTTLTKTSGDAQSTTASTAAASPLVVTVLDQSGNALSGVTVTWAIASGGGSLSAASSTTGSNGQASTTYTAGTTTGTSTITASVTGLAAATFTVTVAASGSTTTDCSSATGTTARVVCLANAFKATLSTTQQTGVQYTLSSTNWVKWSNLPVGAASRNGLTLGSLSSTQLAAALALAQAALSSKGYDSTFAQIRLADSYLSANGGGSAYGAGLYYIAFLGTPSTTSRWMLQLGGHHYAYNLDFNGTVSSTPVTATPMFVGLEPSSFTTGGTTYAPLNGRRDAMYAILASLSTSQLASAKLSSSFSDVLLGPGQDGSFPASQGVADAALASTYVAWSGASTPTVQGSYVRIDGPRVWIEFVCQNGIVFPSQIHYHTVWRDRASDYGGTLSTSSTRAPASTLERWLASPHYTTPAGSLTVVAVR